MKFGDIIKYPHILYSHYAVYTGKNEKGEDTVVEFTGEKGLHSKAGATVRQGPLKPGGIVDNSVDQRMSRKPQSEEMMRAAIDKVLLDQQKYGLLDHNCEHVATFVRLGIPISLQADTVLSTQPNFNNEMSENMGASFSPRLN